ncbi:Cys/Met metabolism pyridoxal-phosphate-dependent enzyme [Campylobacter majalis]|uniref:Cys/Met metabolism pyridoxal-phosphate-dependent enzyme n=1 Tax=Campylobacter majalis TaxID=2790656 RepID=UPI003D694B04
MTTSISKYTQTSTTRLPMDHIISGALLAGITSVAYDISSGTKLSTQTVKNTIKNALAGGIATGAAINAANTLVQKRYIEATLSVVLGIAGVVAIKKI